MNIKKLIPPLLFLSFLIIWKWFCFNVIYSERWYEALGHTLFLMLLVLSYFSLGAGCNYLAEKMEKRSQVVLMRLIEFSFLSLSLYTLKIGFKGKGSVFGDSTLDSAIFVFAAVVLLSFRKHLYWPLIPLFNGAINDVPIEEGLRLAKNGKFDGGRACLSMILVFFLVLLIMMRFQFK